MKERADLGTSEPMDRCSSMVQFHMLRINFKPVSNSDKLEHSALLWLELSKKAPHYDIIDITAITYI